MKCNKLKLELHLGKLKSKLGGERLRPNVWSIALDVSSQALLLFIFLPSVIALALPIRISLQDWGNGLVRLAHSSDCMYGMTIYDFWATTLEPVSNHACARVQSCMCSCPITHVHVSNHACPRVQSRMCTRLITHVHVSNHACARALSRALSHVTTIIVSPAPYLSPNSILFGGVCKVFCTTLKLCMFFEYDRKS